MLRAAPLACAVKKLYISVNLLYIGSPISFHAQTGTEDCAGPPHYRGSPPFSGANAGSTLRPSPGLHHSGEKRGVKTQVFLPRFHARFYNSLIINAPRNEAWPHPDSHYIRTDFKTGYDVLGDTSLVLSVKYSPAKAVPYLKGLSIFL